MDRKEIGKIIRSKREELGLTQEQVATAAGISKPYLSGIETGRANPPADARLGALEKALQFRPGELVTLAHLARTPADVIEMYEQAIANLNGLKSVLRSFMTAQRHDGEKLDAQAIEQLTQDTARPNASAHHLARTGRDIPVINAAAAEYPKHVPDLDDLATMAVEHVRCPDVRDPQAFAVRVFGDSMSPDYTPDDIVIFSPNTPVRSGDDCFIRLAEGGTTFARVYFDTETIVRLQPLNTRYRAQVLTRDQITGLWPAVYRIARLRK